MREPKSSRANCQNGQKKVHEWSLSVESERMLYAACTICLTAAAEENESIKLSILSKRNIKRERADPDSRKHRQAPTGGLGKIFWILTSYSEREASSEVQCYCAPRHRRRRRRLLRILCDIQNVYPCGGQIEQGKPSLSEWSVSFDCPG